MPSSPKWEIIHAHSLSGRFSTLVCPEIHAQPGWLGPVRPLSRSVTARSPFRPYLLQIETSAYPSLFSIVKYLISSLQMTERSSVTPQEERLKAAGACHAPQPSPGLSLRRFSLALHPTHQPSRQRRSHHHCARLHTWVAHPSGLHCLPSP